MKHLTIESFINSLLEEDLWKIIEDYEKWRKTGVDEKSFLRHKSYYVSYYPNQFVIVEKY